MLAPISINRISSPSVEEFYRNHVRAGKPVVITDLTDNWQATQRWNLEYFAHNFGDVEAGVIRLVGGECDLNTYRGSRLNSALVREGIASIAEGRLDNGWAIASPVEVFPPSMQKDYAPPIYCATGSFLRARVFLGPRGTITSLHQDLFENLYTMVKGEKRITLFSPFSPVYPNSRFSKLPNHAQVDPEHPDYERFPDFNKAQPYIVDLVAGETLYLPAFWWHHLRNLESSIAMSFWWATGWKLPVAWAAALYKKLREI